MDALCFMINLRCQLKLILHKFLTDLSALCLACVILILDLHEASAKDPNTSSVFKDCRICPEMVVIPAGIFNMGSRKGKKRELPIQRITIHKPFAIGRFEITFDEWDFCHADGGCSKKIHDRGWGRGRRPVINVLYSDIQEYTTWISNKTSEKYRLPSEAEWEYAARAGTTTEYWWGDHMTSGGANCRDCGTKWSGLKSAPVGSFKANPWGLFDVHGNVLEYVEDCWTDNHRGAAGNASPKVIPKCSSRVIKSGAWYYLPTVSRSAYRARNDTRVFSYFIGFRVFRMLN